MKSTVPGIKTLRLTNAKVGLEKTVEFVAPRGTQRLSIVPSSLTRGTTAQGHVVQVSLGHAFRGGKLQSVDGYQIEISVQGTLTKDLGFNRRPR